MSCDARMGRGSFAAGFVVALIAVGLASSPPSTHAQSVEDEKPLEVESSNPLSGDPEAIEQGKKLFFKWCVACHGVKADGKSRFGSYAANLRKYWRGYGEFVAITLNGRPQKQMPPWKGVLDVQQITTIGAYLETRAIEGANWK